MQNDKKEVEEVHSIIIGSHGVGKTLFCLRFITGLCDDNHEAMMEDSFQKYFHLDDKIIKIEIIDGLSKSEDLNEDSIKKSSIFILMVSITDEESFNQLELSYSKIKSVKKKFEMTTEDTFVIIGSKSDLEEERVIKKEQTKSLAELWKCDFFEISVKLNKNIDETLSSIVRNHLKKIHENNGSDQKNDEETKKNCNLM